MIDRCSISLERFGVPPLNLVIFLIPRFFLFFFFLLIIFATFVEPEARGTSFVTYDVCTTALSLAAQGIFRFTADDEFSAITRGTVRRISNGAVSLDRELYPWQELVTILPHERPPNYPPHDSFSKFPVTSKGTTCTGFAHSGSLPPPRVAVIRVHVHHKDDARVCVLAARGFRNAIFREPESAADHMVQFPRISPFPSPLPPAFFVPLFRPLAFARPAPHLGRPPPSPVLSLLSWHGREGQAGGPANFAPKALAH